MRRRTLIGLTAALVAGIGAECESGGGGGQQPDRDPDRDPDAPPEPWDAQDDLNAQFKVVTISAWVDRDHGPYYVRMHAIDHDTGEQDNPNRHPGDDPRGQRVAGGEQFRYTLAYPTHHRVELSIDLEASKSGGKGYIATRDGRRLRRTAQLNGQLKTSLTIWTER